MHRILVIADDLSGAAEITGIGARYGLSARLERGTPLAAHAQLTVLETNTRLLPQDEAADRVTRGLRHLAGEPFDLVYKKTDSAFRGPVLAELEAVMSCLARRAALLVAQNPSRGRTIRQCVYRIDGVPLASTSFAQDPDHPARTSSPLELLGRSRRCHTDCLPPTAALPEEGVSIGEAETEHDVHQWATRVSNDAAQGAVLPAGGADFFAALLAAKGLTASRPFLSALPPGRTLFTCGTSPAFSTQVVARARQEGMQVCPMPEHLHGATGLEAWRSAARSALDADARALLVIQRPLDRTPGAPQRFQAALAEVVSRLLAAPPGAQNLLLEGGATASAVCHAMSWDQFEIEGEFAPGVVQMRALRRDGSSDHRLVIKPGSYAWPDAVWLRPAAVR